MNLKEEMLKKELLSGGIWNYEGSGLLKVDDAVKIAESYAKEKAWEAWKQCTTSLCDAIHGSRHEQFIDSMLFPIEFEKWWEENR